LSVTSLRGIPAGAHVTRRVSSNQIADMINKQRKYPLNIRVFPIRKHWWIWIDL